MVFPGKAFILTCAGFIALHHNRASSANGVVAKDVKITATNKFPRLETHQKPKPCPIGDFECLSDSSLCIPQSSMCNNKSDCPDNSDEADCLNQHDKNFWDSLFKKRPGEEVEDTEGVTCKYKLRPKPELKMTGDFLLKEKGVESQHSHKTLRFPRALQLQETEDDDVRIVYSEQTVPAGSESGVGIVVGKDWEVDCFCVSEKLFCQNLHSFDLTAIPRDAEFLDLDGSPVNLKEFSGAEFPQLESLILSRCFIEEVLPGAFSSLVKLKTLYLTNNRLRSILSETFVGSSDLHSLFLGYNQLKSLCSNSFAGLTSLRELDLRHNRISELPLGVFAPLTMLRKLHLNHNGIKSISSILFHGLQHLEILSLSGNSIKSIHPGTFQDMISLQGLFLSWNKLTVLENYTFCSMHSLQNLNLHDNEILLIETGAFSCLEGLESLNLERNRFRELPRPQLIFRNLTRLNHIYFDQFWMCWWAPHVRSCAPKGDGISSVENLLDSLILRVCVWLVGLVGVGGNLFVIVSRMVLREPNRVHSFYIKNLALADLLMGIFLLSIAVHDVRFRGEFLARQHSWRHSLTCQLSGVLSTLSLEASVFILTLITMDRYLSIARPFTTERSRPSIVPAFVITSFLWIASFGLSYLPLSGHFFAFFGPDFYSTNGLCLPLHIHNPFDQAWEYSFFLFVLLNSSAFSFICFAYWKMLGIIQSSSLTIRSTQERQDTLLAKRFGIVVLTDFLCWAPVIVAKVLAMSGVSIPSTMYAWLAVFVLPVNSALNPFIYTLTAKLFKEQMSRIIVRLRRKMRRVQLDESAVSMTLLYRSNAMPRTPPTSIRSLRGEVPLMRGTPNAPVWSPGQSPNLLRRQCKNANTSLANSNINSDIVVSGEMHLSGPHRANKLGAPVRAANVLVNPVQV